MTEASEAARVGVVFVNFHSEVHVAPRAGRLGEAGFSVVVADNSGSYEGPGSVLETGGNVGFGAGANRAAARLGPAVDTICFHNPDLDIDTEDLARLRRRLRQQPRPGLVAPALEVGGPVRADGYHLPSMLREMALAARHPSPPARREPVRSGPGRISGDANGRFRGRRFGSGALLVVDRAAFEAMAGFDERYFLYVEDADLWYRFQRAGYSTGFDSSIVARHVGKAGSPASAAFRELLRRVGVELFAELHWKSPWQLVRLIHRMGPWPAAGAGPTGATVIKEWRRGSAPIQVSEAIRAQLLHLSAEELE